MSSGSNFISWINLFSWFNTICWEIFFSFVPLSKVICLYKYCFISGLSVLFHRSLSLYLGQYYTLLMTEICYQVARILNFDLLFKNCIDYFGSFDFSVQVLQSTWQFLPEKQTNKQPKTLKILTKIVLFLFIRLVMNNVWKTLNPPVHKHDIFLCLLRFSLILISIIL